MKSPPLQFTDDEARELVEAFIRGDEEIAVEPKPHAVGSLAPKDLDAALQQKNT
jgi:myo-inositol-1-phosphate synthase